MDNLLEFDNTELKTDRYAAVESESLSDLTDFDRPSFRGFPEEEMVSY